VRVEYWEARPERHKEWLEKYSQKQREYCRKNKPYLRAYGLSRDQYDAMVLSQGGKCFICRELPTARGLFVDHCHKTKRLRKLLCHHCNVALGHLGDNPALAIRCAVYLIMYEKLNT
jgi:hypothetical protein